MTLNVKYIKTHRVTNTPWDPALKIIDYVKNVEIKKQGSLKKSGLLYQTVVAA